MVNANTARLSHDSTLKNQRVDDCFTIAGHACVDVRGSFEKYAQSHGVILKYCGNFEYANLDDNEKELLQIFFNWVSNSLKYDAGTATISVSAGMPRPEKSRQPQDFNGSTSAFTLTVDGDGIGISPMSLARLFYRFCRHEQRRIRSAKLTGGFLFAKIALDLKGASIAVESAKSMHDRKVTTRFNFSLSGAGVALNQELSCAHGGSTPDQMDTSNGNIFLRDADQGVDHKHGHTSDDEFLNKLMSLLECHICDPNFNVSKLVTAIGMSRPVLFRKAKILTGSSIINLIRSRRLKMAAMLLEQKKAVVSEVAYKVGYSDPKYFSKSFRSEYGKTPKEYVHGL